MAKHDCFNCGNYMNCYWSGPVQVVECRSYDGDIESRNFQPFDRMICDRWTWKERECE